jgi:hypothetical protein
VRTRWADAGFFVDVQAETVTGSVPECFPEPARFENASRRRID